FAQQHLRILLPAQHAAQGSRYFAGRERAGRHLVEERLEQMKIAAIDQRDVHRSPFEFQCRVEPGKTSTEDHNAMPSSHRRKSFFYNSLRPNIILPEQRTADLIRWVSNSLGLFCFFVVTATLGLASLSPALADGPSSKDSHAANLTNGPTQPVTPG